MRRSSACGHDGQIRAAEAEVDGDVPRDHIDDAGRHEERRDFLGRVATAHVFLIGLRDSLEPTDTATHHDAVTRCGLAFHLFDTSVA